MKVEETIIEESYYEHKRLEDSGEGPGGMPQARTGVEVAFFDAAGDEGWRYCEDGWHDEDAWGECGPKDGGRTSEEGVFGNIPREVVGQGAAERDTRHNKDLGARGERAAARYLERIGYEILEMNWTCPQGEADVIARDGEALVFVEVKTRTGVSRGLPSEAVTPEKRARYEKIAAWYLADFDEVDIPVRFDVVALLVVAPDRAFLRHYVNAFGVGM